MITHEEARIEAISYNHEAIRVILKYIEQQETLQAEHESLKKDVARYFELQTLDRVATHKETEEVVNLFAKLRKAGKEE